MKKTKDFIDARIKKLSHAEYLPLNDRIEEIKKTGRNILENIDSLATIISQESFIPISDVKFRIANMLKKWEYVELYAEAAFGSEWEKLLDKKWIRAPAREGYAYKTLLPMGVFLNITPATDNVGVALSTMLDLLLAGNSVLLKPATFADKGIFHMLKYFTINLKNFVEIATGDAREVISISVENEDLYGVVYTGTSIAGESIASLCASRQVRYIGEYESNNIILVLDDFDPIDAVNILGHATRGYNGLACACVHIAGLQEKNYQAIKSKLVDFANIVNQSPTDPSLPETLLGPLLDKKLALGCEDLIKRAIDAGSKLLVGGNRHGNHIELTILEGFPNQIAYEYEGPHCGHIYGPVLFIDEYDKILNWSIRANEGRRGYSLRDAILSNDIQKIMEISKILPSAIDTTNIFHFDPLGPWHGMKRSSTAPGAVHFVTEVVNTKYLFIAPKEAILSSALV